MKNEENSKNNNQRKINLISIKDNHDNSKSKQVYKHIKNNAINIQKIPLLVYKKKDQKHLSNNSFYNSLKKNKSQIYDLKNNLPLLNSNNNNSIQNTINKKISVSPIANYHFSLNKNYSMNISGSNKLKALQKKSIKNKFFSIIPFDSTDGNKQISSSNLRKGLINGKTSEKYMKSHNIYIDSSEEDNNKNVNLSINYKERIHLKKRIKFKPLGFSKFFLISKKPDISARNIYEHYILEEVKDELPNKHKKNKKFILKRHKDDKTILNELYGINENNIRRINEIKSNKTIALKDDFNIKEYQEILCNMIKKRCDNRSIDYLKKEYEKFNDDLKNYKRNYKYIGRYSKLAEKIRKSAPNFLIKRLRQLDEENLISKAKYFKVDLNKNQDEKKI